MVVTEIPPIRIKMQQLTSLVPNAGGWQGHFEVVILSASVVMAGPVQQACSRQQTMALELALVGRQMGQGLSLGALQM